MTRVLSVALADIRVADRLRTPDQDWVALLAVSMEARGLQTPLLVGKSGDKFKLVAGAHRLAAAKKLGWEKIDAIVVEGDKLALRLVEIDENLIRRELSELDRSAFLAERKAIYEELHPETRKGGDHTSEASKATSLSLCFTAEVAEKLGVSERNIQRSIARHRRLDPEVREQIRSTWIADNGVNLDALVRLPPAEQKRVVKLLLRDKDPLPSVGAALKQLRGTKDEDEGDKVLKALIAKFRTARAPTRDAFLQHLHEAGEIDAFLEKKQRRAA